MDTTRHSRFKEDVRDTDMHVLLISRRELAGNHRAIEADVALSNEWAGVFDLDLKLIHHHQHSCEHMN